MTRTNLRARLEKLELSRPPPGRTHYLFALTEDDLERQVVERRLAREIRDEDVVVQVSWMSPVEAVGRGWRGVESQSQI